jgi:hypothetical protein
MYWLNGQKLIHCHIVEKKLYWTLEFKQLEKKAMINELTMVTYLLESHKSDNREETCA